MLSVFLGRKLQQTQLFTENGKRIPVTEIEMHPAVVTQVKTDAIDGYWAVQLGFGQKPQTAITKQLIGHLKKTGKDTFPRFLKEVRFVNTDPENAAFKIGDTISLKDVFKTADRVKVTGISKAKGFQGGVKRHGFKGGPRTHGQSDRERAPGSIGQTTTPGRVYKGKRMAGHMGGDKITIKGLEVITIDESKNTMKVKGLVPGRVNTYVVVEKQV